MRVRFPAGTRMPRQLRPSLAILPVSVLAPCLWLLVQSTRLSNYYAGGVLEPALLYGVLPALTLWLGSLPVALATWLLWPRRCCSRQGR